MSSARDAWSSQVRGFVARPRALAGTDPDAADLAALAGELTLGYQVMVLEGIPGHRLGAYHAEPGTPDHDAMILLDLTAPTSHAVPRTSVVR